MNVANSSGESTVFIEFMLDIIKDALYELNNNSNVKNDGINDGINVGINNDPLAVGICKLMKMQPKISAKDIASELNVSQRQVERKIAILKDMNYVKRVGARKNGAWIVNR